MVDEDERDPVQQFYARQPQPPEYIDRSIGKPEFFRIVRSRVGSPLKARVPYAITALLLFVVTVWDLESEIAIVLLGVSAVSSIAIFYIYAGMARASMWVLRSWLFAPDRQDEDATFFEWILFFVTIGLLIGAAIFAKT